MDDTTEFKDIIYRVKNIQSYPAVMNNFSHSKSLFPNIFFVEFFCSQCWFHYIKQPKLLAVLMSKSIKRWSAARLY